ncbi:uncharacterized protein LOC135106485 [Scylla paramamosain]|uniref:uncharacterized protein LOC135106485 n=1 Tax=Scylla paramamosain TaxID=85552 RepID=UPI003083D810
MEQEVNRHQPMGVPHSFGRWRSALQSVSQDSSSEQSSVWNEGTCNKISRSDGENMIDNCSSVTKLHGNQRRGPLIPLRDVNNSIEPTEGVQVLGTQSAKKQYGYKSITSFRKSHQRRSCAPRFMNTGSESPWATNATANEGYKNDKTNNLYSSATKFPVSQGEDCENVPEEPAVPKFTSRFQSRLRRRSSLLKCEGDAETKITENCSESTNATANEGYKSDRTNNLYSSATKFPMSQGDDCENVPEEPAVPKFTSRFQSRLRRRSSLLKCEGDLKTKIQDNVIENCSESKDKSRNEHKTILEDEQEEADVISSHFKSSKVRMDNQEEPASEKESEQKSHFLVGEGRRRLSGAKGRRSLLEFARQRALVSQSSVERVTASGGSEIAPSGQRPGISVCRSRFSQWMPNGSLGKISQQKDLPVTNKAEGNKLQDCRKMLAFESGDEGEDSEDQTAPLSMLVQTPIMNRASVLQNPRDQKQQKKVCEPIIKKSLLDNGVKTSRFRRKSIVIRQQPEDNSASSHQNMELKVSRFTPPITNKSVNPSSEALLWHRTQPENSDAPSHTLQEASTYSCSSISSEKKINVPAHPGSTKRMQRRRSAAVLCVRTPMKRKSMSFEPKSTSKLICSSVSSKTLGAKGTQKHIKSRRSLIVGTQLSSLPQSVNKVIPSDSECLHEENTMQDKVTSGNSNKVDASTNTTINFAKIKHLDLKVLKDIESLLKEQEELNAEAVLLQDKTTARRLEMKQKKLMESFATSISPLKRLKAMFSENHVEEGEVKESPQQDKAEGESGACESAVATQESHCSLDQSGTEWVSPKAPLDIRNHQIQWRRRQQDNRLTRTFQESSIKEEEFAEPYQGDTSPFTILVGDCERPSLAPMTPHSRKHVGMLKLSLKEQLEQLYNN